MSGQKAITSIKKHKAKFVFIVIIVIATCFLVYPSFMDEIANFRQTMSIGGYTQDIAGMSEEKISELKKNAIAYNEKIYQEQKIEPFRYEGEEYDDEEYDRMLKFSDITGVMAYVDIPNLNIYVPVSHGTKMKTLAYQAGHMHGTSLPIGGENTHCVIAGHTGLTNTDLFDNLEKLKEGDEVLIKVLNETHIYKVIEINVVLPEYCDGYLQIKEGQDLVTLFTCTPYGVNSHRLLVKCERAGTVIDGNNQGAMANVNNRNIKAILLAVMWGLIPVAVGVGAWYFLFKRKPKVAGGNSKTNK